MSVAAFGAATASAATALVTPSWNGYRWARTGNLEIALGDNVSAAWDPFVTRAAGQWSRSGIIDFKVTTGRTNAATCGAVYGTVQVCNSNYGATGWLGYATLFTSGTYIVQATVKLNDYYFSQARYNTSAFKNSVACQEIGHTLGLGHIDTNNTNANLGTCMDYSNDPAGTSGRNGTLSNINPGAPDWAALNGIYAVVDTTQLPFTRPGFWVSDAYSIDGEHHHASGSVPEPSTWAMLLVGFGLVGASVRRRPAVRLAA